ncbi:hypothetical protein Nepgr_006762 [Nepenthes gracilis]|uniref:Uncharacterized protein n=1 Tax=Nepenthes gracilis TaxID=150966 RepID=A0AAD3S6F7_NEPGR|nr:hypothetical protein Nepgr_006762 [Nepenthes gracilis]
MLEGSCQFVQHLSQMGGDDHVLADFAGDLDGVHLWLLVGGGNLGVGTWGGSFASLCWFSLLVQSCLTVGAASGCCPAAGCGEVWPFDAGWLTIGAGGFMMPVSGSGFLDGGWISVAGAVQSIL